uniref:efflux RND transporter periplasmic adaptor subunit n=1 Tax=Mariniflexile sp. TaxID=1979402 RepID=UPI0040483091
VYPLKTFQGKVSNISVKADASRKFKVTIEVENTKDHQLRAGLFAEVHFNGLEANEIEATVIPREAIVGSIQSPSVYVVENNKAILKKIETGAVIGGDVVILSGLNKGEQVVTKGIINLTNNTEVKITNQ